VIVGARQGAPTALRRLAARAFAQDLSAIVIPGPEVARAHGLDLDAAGIRVVPAPRHASLLLVVGPTPHALREAATVIYAQMMRPRALLAVGTEELSPLPEADIAVGLSQQDLIAGVSRLRTALSEGAFQPAVTSYDAPMLRSRIEYTCPMHPEIVQSEPGSCPKCGMTLVPRDAQAMSEHAHADHGETDAGAAVKATPAHDHGGHHSMGHSATVEYTCPMHPEIAQSEPGSCPKCGMTLVPREAQDVSAHDHGEHHGMDHAGMEHATSTEYTCPMHPDVVQNEPGSCLKCGMTLVPREAQATAANDHGDHAGMDHAGMDHGDMAFMSMVEVTRNLPRSRDGLPMDWIEVPFGPLFPGLPGGLLLALTLDGDTVAKADVRSLVANGHGLQGTGGDAGNLIEHLGGMDPLAPVAYRVLACRALEQAAGVAIGVETAHARVGALERERIASHLGWLAEFGRQTGFAWLARRAGELQLRFIHAGIDQIAGLRPAVHALASRLERTPLLKPRLSGIGRLAPDTALRGPVARAAGVKHDARTADETYSTLGFSSVIREQGDALARLRVRISEITHSLDLVRAAGIADASAPGGIGAVSGEGQATVETPRGTASLRLTLEHGRVMAAQLDTPSTHHLALVGHLIEQRELGDALVAVASLDLSPWEVVQ